MQNENEIILGTERQRGIITHMQNGYSYGFIKTAGRKATIFFHAKGLMNANYEDLKEGDVVSFLLVAQGDRDKAIAIEVENA